MKDIVTSFVGSALMQIFTIISGVLLARLLLPTGRGELAAVILWSTMIAAVGILGLHEATAFHAAKRSHEPRQILAASFALGFVLSIVLVPVAYVVINIVFADARPEVLEAAVFFIAFIPLNFVGLFIVSLFQGELKIVEWNILRTVAPGAYALLIIVFYGLGFVSVFAFAVAALLASASTVAVGLVAQYRRGWLGFRCSLRDLQPAADLLRYGLKVHIGEVAKIVGERLDQLLISVLLAAADLGLFVVATVVSRGVTGVSSIFSVLAFPKIANQPTGEGRALVFGRYMRAAVLAGVAAAVILFWLFPWILEFFFGRAFLTATAVGRLLIFATLASGIKLLFSAALKGYDRALLISRAEFAGLALSAVFLALLLPRYGLIGAAWAAIISQTGTVLYMANSVRRDLGVGLVSLFRPTMEDVKLVVERLRELRG